MTFCTDLRLYKGTGDYLEFKVGDDTTEGRISVIYIHTAHDGVRKAIIEYVGGSKAGFENWPMTYRIAKNSHA